LTKICLYCKNPFGPRFYSTRAEAPSNFNKRNYCSHECRIKARITPNVTAAAFRKRTQRLIPTMDHCENCGSTEKLQRHHYRGLQNYDVAKILCQSCHATEHVQEDTWGKGAKQPKPCIVCGQLFMTRHSTNNTCSRRCLQEVGRQNALKRWASRDPYRACLNCGKAFQYERPRQLTCSRSCGHLLAWKKRSATLCPTA